jgi:AraC-like DNA-binding protein
VAETQRSGVRAIASAVSYSEQRSRLVPATVWSKTGGGGRSEILPDGCMDLIWTPDGLLVAGPDTSPVIASGAAEMIALRFDPGIAPLVLDCAADELVNRRIDLADIAGAGPARRLQLQVAESADPAAELQRHAAARLASMPPPRWLRPATALLVRGTPVADVAREVSASPRQLQRWSRQHYGYGAKSLQRILRVNSAIGRLRGGGAPSDTAHLCGYADYAHMFREFRSVTQRSPTEFAGQPSAA